MLDCHPSAYPAQLVARAFNEITVPGHGVTRGADRRVVVLRKHVERADDRALEPCQLESAPREAKPCAFKRFGVRHALWVDLESDHPDGRAQLDQTRVQLDCRDGTCPEAEVDDERV